MDKVLMKFFLEETQRLSKKRHKDMDDVKQELGTYNDGYWDALTDIAKAMTKFTQLD